MKTRTFGFLTAVALAALAGCAKETAPEVSHTYTFTIDATKAGESDTKALSVDGSTLSRTWGIADKVYVYNTKTWSMMGGYLQPQAADYGKTTATLTGTLTGKVNSGDGLRLYCHLKDPSKRGMDYRGQAGTLDNVSVIYDFGRGDAVVKEVKGGVIVPEATTTFTSEQAVVKFVFKDKSGARIYPTSLKLDIQNANGDHYIKRWDGVEEGDPEGVLELTGINPSTTTDGVYVAIRMRPDDDTTPTTKMIFEAEDGNYKYTGEVAGRITFQNGKYYVRNVTFKKDATYIGAETLLSNAQKDKHLGWVVDKDAKIYPPEAVKKGAVDAKAVIVYFDDANTPGKRLCIARRDLNYIFEGYPESNWERACWTDAHWYKDWVGDNPVAGCTWKLPSREDWTNIWKYRNVLGSETFPVRNLLSAADASLARFNRTYYWTSTNYSLNEAYVFQIYDFEGRYEKVGDEYEYGFLDEHIRMDKTGVHVRYVFTF